MPHHDSSLHDPAESADADGDQSGETLGIQELVRETLVRMGEDPDREGLLKTPLRVDRAMTDLTRGYHMNVQDVLNGAVFEEKYDEMVIIKQIEFYSMCEHHMLPFFGVAHVGYIPNGKVIGLSKIPRIVEIFSRRLQLQERMTFQIAECLMEILSPNGVGVVTEAQHLCMMMRGVQKEQSYAMSSAMLGSFRTSRPTRNEFLSLISHSGIK